MDKVGEINVTEFEITKDPVGWNLVVTRDDQAPIKRIMVRMFTIQDDIHGRLDNVYIERVGKHFRIIGVGYKGKLPIGKLLALKNEHERIRDVYIDFNYIDSRTNTAHPPCIVVNYESYETVVDLTAAKERAMLASDKRGSTVPVVMMDDKRASLTTATPVVAIGEKRKRRNHKRSSSWFGSIISAFTRGENEEEDGEEWEDSDSKRTKNTDMHEDSDTDVE